MLSSILFQQMLVLYDDLKIHFCAVKLDMFVGDFIMVLPGSGPFLITLNIYIAMVN